MRKVYIRHEPNQHSFFVCYLERKPNTRHYFAQFDDRSSDMAKVTQYVRNSAKVQLVCAISGNAI